MLVIVPSKARASQLARLTGAWLFPSEVTYRILVEPQDVEAYKEYVSPSNMLVLPENDRGMEYAEAIGKQWADDNFYDTVFKIDDDIVGWASLKDKGKGSAKARDNVKRFLNIVRDIEEPLKNENCGGISFGYRQEFWHDKTWYAINQRFQTCYVVKTKLYRPSLESPRRGKWEDYINFLRVIEDGHKVIRYGKYQMDTRVGEEAGKNGSFYSREKADFMLMVIGEVKSEFPWLNFKQKPNGMVEPDMNNEAIGGKKL